MDIDPIVIVSAKRTPIGHFGGYFKDVSAPTLGGYAISAVIHEAPECIKNIDQVLMGCVLSAGLGQAPARQAALAAKLPTKTPCTTINKMCGSGMEAVMLARRAILSNCANIVIAGGMENMSRAPYLLAHARFGYRFGNQTMFDHMLLDGLTNAYEPKESMGKLAENCAAKLGITREHQDAFAIASTKRAIEATQKGLFSSEITPVTLNNATIEHDEGISKANLEKIPALKPAFLENGTITAANSSSISDGAAALLLMRESMAKKLNLTPLAKIVADQSVAQEPEWFSTAPVLAIETLMKKMEWTVDNVDLFEINEAFAVVTLAAMKTLSIPFDKINVHGGACVLGHPIGASGARILVTLIHSLKHLNKKRGIAALCIGGGEATAIAVEIY
ncbi:MAG: acetyl-CoA C-acyltransferase [Coxiellaceae bacterium]|nr:acetyl-CoA C-acyltransferase [Coxiellaceae bacterium]